MTIERCKVVGFVDQFCPWSMSTYGADGRGHGRHDVVVGSLPHVDDGQTVPPSREGVSPTTLELRRKAVV